MWKAVSFFVLSLVIIMISGCAEIGLETRSISSLDDIQGKWKIVEITDPSGNVFQPEGNLVMVIEGKNAVSDGSSLQLQMAADNSYVRLLANVNGIETKVSDVRIDITTDPLQPVQMIWMDRTNTKQVSIFQKE